MEVAGLPVRMLEPKAAFAKVDLACDPRIDHPLQRPVHSGSTDALIFTANDIDQIVSAEVTFLPQEHVDDLFPLARALAAVGLQPREVRKATIHALRRSVCSSDAERTAAPAGGCGIGILDGEPAAGHGIDEVHFGAFQIADAHRVDEQLDAVRFEDLVANAAVLLDHQPVLEARTAAALHEYAQPAAGFALFRKQLADFRGGRLRHIHHNFDSPGDCAERFAAW